MNIEQKRIQKRIGIVIFFLLFISYSYFLQDVNNWNPVTRVALGISMIQDGSLKINKFRPITKDMAYYERNYYSDKAPGMTFSALPAIALSILYLDSTVQNYKWINNQKKVTDQFIFVMQMATIFTSALLTALAAVGLYMVAIRFGAGIDGAAFGALAFGLATPAWGWSTVLFGHAPAGACLFLALALILYLLKSPRSGRIEIAAGFCAGALLSWAAVIEYTSAPASAIIAIYGLVCAWKWERTRFLRVLTAAVAGAVIFILPLLIYNYIVYDDLFISGYRFHSTFSETKVGFYGIKSPKLPVIARLLFGMKRGIIWLSPLLLFVPYALYRQWKIPGQKGLVATIVLVAMYYFLWNSGYIYWTGGSTTGPRFLTPVLPFLCLPLAVLWSKAGKYLKGSLFIFFALSFFISLTSVSISMTLGIKSRMHYVIEYLIPRFLDGMEFKTSYILQMMHPDMNGSGHLELVPLYITIVVAGAYIIWQIRKYNSMDQKIPDS